MPFAINDFTASLGDSARNLIVDYSLENLGSILNDLLVIEEQKYGIHPVSQDAYGTRLKNVIMAATQKTGKQVVVLIDEYDAPMHDSINNKDLQKTIRNVMRDLFKSMSESMPSRFTFLIECASYISIPPKSPYC